MSSSGTTTSRSSSLRVPASTSSIGRPPGDEPADLLQRALRRREADALRRPLRERLEPLEREREVRAALRPATAWTSSTITVSTVRRSSRAREVSSIRNSDSGVVIRMSGGVRSICARSRCGVSPVRTADRQPEPSPASGAAQVALDVVVERLQRRDVEQAQALAPASRSAGRGPSRNAASVLPDPVGAWISTLPPRAIAGQPATWAGVGLGNARSNHARVPGERAASASTKPAYPPPPTLLRSRADDGQGPPSPPRRRARCS